MKTSVAGQQFRRAIDLSSDIKAEEKSRCKISDLLRENNFPKAEIQRAESEARHPVKRLNQLRPQTTLRLPFCPDGSDKEVRRIVHNSKLAIRAVYKQGPSFKQRFVRSALLPKTCVIHGKRNRVIDYERNRVID